MNHNIVYIDPLNGYRELNSYEEPCIDANGNAITSFARELNPTGAGEHIHIVIYIYIYIYITNDFTIEMRRIQFVNPLIC